MDLRATLNAGPPEKRKKTIASRISHDLRQAILRGEMEPGAKINLDRIRETRGIGVGSVREAVSRLVSDGLVEFEDQRGYRVAPISLANLNEVTQLRIDLETLALRYAIDRGDLHWESSVVAALHELNRTTRNASSPDSVETWETVHAAFHLRLVNGSGMPILTRFCEVLNNLNDRYRRILLGRDPLGRDVRAEHGAIADAVVERDADKACAVLGVHIANTGENLRNRLASDLPAAHTGTER